MTRGRRVVSVVGATGLVGSELVRVIEVRGFPMKEIRLFSSGRGPMKRTRVRGDVRDIRPFSLDSVGEDGICFLAAGGAFSKRFAWEIARRGNVVIDNSSVFRMDPDVPLVVPEVNGGEISKHRGLVANPNCSTIQMVLALAPLHRAWRLRRVVVATYQSVSGAGHEATGELAAQTSARLAGRRMPPEAFRHPIAFNLIPRIDDFDDDGWTREERKVMNETKKILGDQTVDVVATAVRVPVFRCHSEAVYAEFGQAVDAGLARRMLGRAPGVAVIDDPGRSRYPMPVDCAGSYKTFVGRVRRHPSRRNTLCMWVVSDNLLKGAALNAVQIGELVA